MKSSPIPPGAITLSQVKPRNTLHSQAIHAPQASRTHVPDELRVRRGYQSVARSQNSLIPVCGPKFHPVQLYRHQSSESALASIAVAEPAEPTFLDGLNPLLDDEELLNFEPRRLSEGKGPSPKRTKRHESVSSTLETFASSSKKAKPKPKVALANTKVLNAKPEVAGPALNLEALLAKEVAHTEKKYAGTALPAPLDPETLLGRLEGLFPLVKRLLTGAQSSYFYSCARDIQSQSPNDEITMAEFSSLKLSTIFPSGYFGPRRQTLVAVEIQKRFAVELTEAYQKNATIRFWSLDSFSRYVLANELLCRLVMEDFACAEEAAYAVMEATVDYGKHLADRMPLATVKVTEAPSALPPCPEPARPGPALLEPALTKPARPLPARSERSTLARFQAQRKAPFGNARPRPSLSLPTLKPGPVTPSDDIFNLMGLSDPSSEELSS